MQPTPCEALLGYQSERSKEGAMAEYRLYSLDAADHIVAGYSVYCISDRAALTAARRLAERAPAVEVWQSTRCLGSVTAWGS